MRFISSVLFLLLASLFSIHASEFHGKRTTASMASASSTEYTPDLDGRVAVDFYVMSRCPDAVACEQTFLSSLQEVKDLIKLDINYIATQNNNQFQCLHGPNECAGNMQQLCAHVFYPQLTQWTNFVLCQSNSSHSIPDNGMACAQSAGLDYNVIDNCVKKFGPTLLSQSIGYSNAANETVSCTVNLNKQFWCQHNGGWVDCAEGTTGIDIISAVCNRYVGSAPLPYICEPIAKKKKQAGKH